MTRAELHALVWAKPMTEIAREFGVRDQHVAQACDANDIARPRAGHWQKIDHEKTVESEALDNMRYALDAVVLIQSAARGQGRRRKSNGESATRRKAA
ncbi:hypothetical protein [Shinella sp.]|uniref:hypothetical protein n=1 Tax=Shinella sp. TaxID=1870904 RepID=UPI00258E8A87|nr:hypothetical protein [Shinella sp.]MCW5706958.1 hypothetical protein [Shinella sp.]